MKKIKFLLVGALVTGGSLLVSTPAFAEETNGSVELTEGQGSNGALSLDSISTFDFGKHSISTDEAIYPAEIDQAITVTDLRGTGAGWTLAAKITEFSNTDHVLAGAQLTLANGKLTSNGGSTAPISQEVELNEASQPILTAEKDSGLGSWNLDYTGAELKVPSGNYIGAYIATIDWTLTNGPVAP